MIGIINLIFESSRIFNDLIKTYEKLRCDILLK